MKEQKTTTSRQQRRFLQRSFKPLTNSQWEIIKNLLDKPRKRKYALRDIFDGLLKITRTGTQWRNLDACFPPWELVYYYFRKWQKKGVLTFILNHLVGLERVRQERNVSPSSCAVDSQSVKVAAFINEEVGIDGFKKINGRKRHIAVDSLGLPLAIHVSAANTYDGNEGIELFSQLEEVASELEIIFADSAYKGYFKECAAWYKWKVEITQRPPNEKGFVPQKGRWQVERSLGWFIFFRRLAKDYEKTVESSVAFIQNVFITIILARLDTENF
jgi:putative transposase